MMAVGGSPGGKWFSINWNGPGRVPLSCRDACRGDDGATPCAFDCAPSALVTIQREQGTKIRPMFSSNLHFHALLIIIMRYCDTSD